MPVIQASMDKCYAATVAEKEGGEVEEKKLEEAHKSDERDRATVELISPAERMDAVGRRTGIYRTMNIGREKIDVATEEEVEKNIG